MSKLLYSTDTGKLLYEAGKLIYSANPSLCACCGSDSLSEPLCDCGTPTVSLDGLASCDLPLEEEIYPLNTTLTLETVGANCRLTINFDVLNDTGALWEGNATFETQLVVNINSVTKFGVPIGCTDITYFSSSPAAASNSGSGTDAVEVRWDFDLADGATTSFEVVFEWNKASWESACEAISSCEIGGFIFVERGCQGSVYDIQCCDPGITEPI